MDRTEGLRAQYEACAYGGERPGVWMLSAEAFLATLTDGGMSREGAEAVLAALPRAEGQG